MQPSQVVIRPVVSEKSYVLASAGKYVFRVHPTAHKTQIRQAIESLFEVNVVSVRTQTVKSKLRAARADLRPHARVEEGHRAGRSRAGDPHLPGTRGALID
jgi:ribosomal protein L23